MDPEEKPRSKYKEFKEVKDLQLKIIRLEKQIETIEKKGIKLRSKDLISLSFFATITSTIIVITIILFILLKNQVF